jgi:ceramide glucosyltransferase
VVDRVVIAVLIIAALVALAYQVVALVAVFHHQARRLPQASHAPPVSILKPLYGLDDNLETALRDHGRIDYPEYEVLLGVRTGDAAEAVARRVAREFPQRLRLVRVTSEAPNGKVGALIDLAREARHPVLVVNDSDIRVQSSYLQRVAAPLADPHIGMVTCLYRATASSWAGRWEALGINTDFMPSTLVAPLVGVRGFGLGSTLCFRRADLDAVGGFAAIRDYIADDYQLARRITGLGTRSHLSEVVVETHLSDPTWGDVWRHQVRWARTIRVSRGGGFLGLPVTHAGLWALLCLAAGLPWLALILCAVRTALGVAAGFGVLRSKLVLEAAPLIPLWDLWAFAVWCAGLGGATVEWRGEKLRLGRDGRLKPLA